MLQARTPGEKPRQLCRDEQVRSRWHPRSNLRRRTGLCSASVPPQLAVPNPDTSLTVQNPDAAAAPIGRHPESARYLLGRRIRHSGSREASEALLSHHHIRRHHSPIRGSREGRAPTRVVTREDDVDRARLELRVDQYLVAFVIGAHAA